MPRLDTNRAAEMEVFVRVVDLGGFTAAAREFRLTPSGVSKLVSRLEGRLGARLFNRSTRNLQLTPEGQNFYARAVRVLADMDEAELEAAAGTAPRGHLRINSNIPLGMRYVMPLIPQFLERHPEVTLDVTLSDTVVDLMRDRADIAIRVGAAARIGVDGAQTGHQPHGRGRRARLSRHIRRAADARRPAQSQGHRLDVLSHDRRLAVSHSTRHRGRVTAAGGASQ